ncbi:MAG: DUF5684 domain-containing protein [Cyanobacteriota bacterium]|nr:DUF5684 domain-containing protein [Cyanobacteriota bacterium]
MISLSSLWHSTYFLAQTGEEEAVKSFGIIGYIIMSYCFQKIYQRLGEPNAWFAWVPILSSWIMYKAGDETPWWTLGLFIPGVNIIALIALLSAFIKIVKKLGKNPWLILLMIVPLLNFWVMYHYAFT